MIKTLQEICFVHADEVPEIIADELIRKIKWRLFQLAFYFIRLLTDLSSSMRDVYLHGGFLRDAIRGTMPRDIDIVVTGIISQNCVNQCISMFKRYVDITIPEFFSESKDDDVPYVSMYVIEFKIHTISIKMEIMFTNPSLSTDFDVNSLSFSDWNYLISYCGRKIHDSSCEFDSWWVDIPLANSIKENKCQLSSDFRKIIMKAFNSGRFGNGEVRKAISRVVKMKLNGFMCDDELFDLAFDHFIENRDKFKVSDDLNMKVKLFIN